MRADDTPPSFVEEGTEAMAMPQASARLAHLWQFPLLMVSLALFSYSAYRFIDPKGSPRAGDRLHAAKVFLQRGDADSAITQANRVLASANLTRADEAGAHLLLAQALETGQKQKRLSLKANHQRIIEQSKLAVAGGVAEDADLYRRVGESQEALDHPAEALLAYTRALALDPDHSTALQRKVIELQLAENDSDAAEQSIDAFLRSPKLGKGDKAWAMEQKARVLIARSQFDRASKLLEEARLLDGNIRSQGEAHYWLAWCRHKLGQFDEAERLLRVARDQMTVADPLEGDAGYLLGNIRAAKGDLPEAIACYEAVLTSHPESKLVLLARLGRGLARLGLMQDEAGMNDLHESVAQVKQRPQGGNFSADVVKGLEQAAALLARRQRFAYALELFEQEQDLAPNPPAEFFARLADVLEKRADQLEAPSDSDSDEALRKRQQQARDLRIEAGDCYQALSRKLTLADDHGQAEAAWKAIDRYDRSGATPRLVAALEEFVSQRPSDGQTPEAMLRLGRAYQARGQFDLAIDRFQKNQMYFPQSLAASKSGVPLAQCLIAKGPAGYAKAERVLREMLEQSPLLTPEAEEFRSALFELSQLYYRTGRYEEAVAKLEEMAQRYPTDPRMAQMVFLIADSYRKSAALLAAGGPATQPATTNPADASARAEASAARIERLQKARSLFAQAIDLFRRQPPRRDLEKLYQKLSFFYRADCAYDLKDYAEAIKLYDAATLRYQDDPSSVAAYVQVVNAYVALGRPDDAKTANERAKWLLRRMPAEAFEAGKAAISKEYWNQWLTATADSGMYGR